MTSLRFRAAHPDAIGQNGSLSPRQGTLTA